MIPDDDWSALTAAWQAQPIDVEALRRASLRRGRRMRLLMALDVVLAVIAVGLVAHLLLGDAGFVARVGAGIGIVALTASVWINFSLRRGLWHAANDSAVGLLKLQRERRRNAIRMALWGPVFLPLGALTGFLISRGTPRPETAAGWPPSLKLALIGVLVAAFCLGSLLYVRRQRRRIAAIDAHLAQLDPPGGP